MFGGANGCSLLCRVAIGLGVVRKHTPFIRLVARGDRFISPPKFCFTPEPVCLDTERRRPPSVPFSGHAPVRSDHAALVDDSDEEECNRLGSVFFVVALDGSRGVCVVATCYVCLH